MLNSSLELESSFEGQAEDSDAEETPPAAKRRRGTGKIYTQKVDFESAQAALQLLKTEVRNLFSKMNKFCRPNEFLEKN